MTSWTLGPWLRRNAVALVVLVAAAAALVWIVLGRQLIINAELQPPPVEVAKGEAFEAAGYSWTLVASGEFPHTPDNVEVPEGLAVTAAIIEVRPGDHPEDSASCAAELTSGHGPEARRWTTLGNPYAFNYAVADDSTLTCLLDGEPFDLEVVYLAPEGTISEAVVELEIGVIDGEVVRFALTD
jgi:hypothetical protein